MPGPEITPGSLITPGFWTATIVSARGLITGFYGIVIQRTSAESAAAIPSPANEADHWLAASQHLLHLMQRMSSAHKKSPLGTQSSRHMNRNTPRLHQHHMISCGSQHDCLQTTAQLLVANSSAFLHLHTRRASYQAAIWRKSLERVPDIPSPKDHG